MSNLVHHGSAGDWETIVGSPDVVVIPSGQPHDVEADLAAGRAVLVLGQPDAQVAASAGISRLEPFGRHEWFAIRRGVEPALRRLPAEWAVVAPITVANELSGATTVVAVSIGFRERALVTVRRSGPGLVVWCGVDEVAPGSHLARVLRRLVHRVEARPALGVGIVGYGPYGGMGHHHGLAATTVEGLTLVAAADPSDERRKAAEAQLPGLATFATAEELAADPGVDVAFVATPPSAHAELAAMLLDAGKHVVVEKPMCLTVAEADRLIALARSHDRILSVHQNRRWDRDVRAVLAAVTSGAIGEVFEVSTFVGGFEHPCRAWHSEHSISGGAIYDWGSHHLDWVFLLMGGHHDLPVTVTASGHKRVWMDVTNLDQVRVRLRWADGREAEFFQSDVLAVRPPKLLVQGTAGTIEVRYQLMEHGVVVPPIGWQQERFHHAEAPGRVTMHRVASGTDMVETILPLEPDATFAFHANLADHAEFGEPLAVTPDQVRTVVGVMEAAERSLAQGSRPVELASVLS